MTPEAEALLARLAALELRIAALEGALAAAKGTPVTLTIKKPPPQGAASFDTWFVPKSGAGLVGYFSAVGAASALVANNLVPGGIYVFAATVDCWLSQAAAATAAKSAGSFFVAKGIQILIDGAQGAQLAVLQDAAAGNCSLTAIDG